MTVIAHAPKIMGVLNITPDSFYDGGRFFCPDKAVARALQMIEEGADIIDIGGESTRPGAIPISAAEECARVIPVIKQLKRQSTIPLSIDTRQPAVMQAAIDAGVSIINDVTALQTVESLTLVANNPLSVCLMHMQGTPQTMQQHPTYQSVLADIYAFFQRRIAECEAYGIARERIWLDPGFGFGKTTAHNLELLGNLSYFHPLGCPLLVGVSRKSFIGEILQQPPAERLYGSLTAAILALIQGAAIIRSHDVAPLKQALVMVKALQPYWQKGKANVIT